jgi:hypothetical protein
VTEKQKISDRKADNHNTYEKKLYSIKEMVLKIGATDWYWRSQIWGGQPTFC